MARQTVKQLVKAGINPNGAHALILGFTFKENCPDVRNTKVIDVVNELESFSINVEIHDPLAPRQVVEREHGRDLIENPKAHQYDLVFLAVPHEEFVAVEEQDLFRYLRSEESVFVDLKGMLRSPRVTWSL